MGGSSAFQVSSSEFVPTNVIAGQEAFESFDEAFTDTKGKKSKKQQRSAAQKQKEAEEAAAALPTKGKPLSFFAHSGVLSQDQMVFVYMYYPQYSQNPLDIFNWLYGEAQRIEYEEAQSKLAE